MSKNTEELREKLAAIEHERWADWQKWCHKVLRENNPSPEIGDVLERWDRQIETPYAELSDSEKASDMEQVDRYWPLIDQYISHDIAEAHLDELDYHKHTADSIIKGIKYSNNQTYYMNRAIEVDVRIAKYEKLIAQLTRKEK